MSLPDKITAQATEVRRILDAVLAIAGHPAVSVVWALIRPHVLRQWTPEQLREFDARQADYDRLIADAQRRAGQ